MGLLPSGSFGVEYGLAAFERARWIAVATPCLKTFK